MALKLSIRTTKLFPLAVDPEEDPLKKASVTIRQANQAALEDLGDLISETTRQRGSDRYTTRFNPALAQRIQVFHTLAGADNILDEKEKPLLKFKDGKLDMTGVEFAAVWGKLPPDYCTEIYEHVLEMNPLWGFGEVKSEDEEKNQSAES